MRLRRWLSLLHDLPSMDSCRVERLIEELKAKHVVRVGIEFDGAHYTLSPVDAIEGGAVSDALPIAVERFVFPVPGK